MSDSTTTPVCYRHPDRITGLSCTTCEKPICVECSHDAAVGQKCPECARIDGRARVVQARASFARPSFATAPVSIGIIAVTSAIFAVGYLSPELERTMYQTLSLVRPPGAIIGGEIVTPDVYRIFTVALVHGGLMHILFNMYALWLFGPRLEQQVGSAAFATMYAASAAAGGLASMAFGGDGGWAVGASGAIFGLFGAWMFVAWRMRHSPGGRAMFNQLAVLMLINMALPFLVPGIDWLGHAGGFTGGVVLAAAWSAFAVGRPNARTIRTVLGLALIAVIVAASFIVI